MIQACRSGFSLILSVDIGWYQFVKQLGNDLCVVSSSVSTSCYSIMKGQVALTKTLTLLGILEDHGQVFDYPLRKRRLRIHWY